MQISDQTSWQWFMYDQAVTIAQYPLLNHEATTNAALGICPLGTRVLVRKAFASNVTATAAGLRKGDGSVYIAGNTPVLSAAIIGGTQHMGDLNILLDDGMGIIPTAGTGLVVVIYRLLL